MASSPQAPGHKLVPGTGFIVDGFRFVNPKWTAYFLSHAHSDHYTGLRDNWSQGPIYCSETTAVLVQHMLGLSPQWLRPLPLDTPTTIQGVEVTLVDANHCPGAVQFLFELPDGCKYVHTGDMRYSPAFQDNPHLQRFRGADALYLDTTYCNPRYTFPAQEESIEYVANTIHSLMQPGAEQAKRAVQGDQHGDQGLEQGQEEQQPQQQEREEGGDGDAEHKAGQEPGKARKPSRLFLISTYGIGKERVLAAVRRQCGVRLHVTDRKLGVMRCLDLAGYSTEDLFTTDPAETPVHVAQWGFLGETWPFFRANFVNMEAYRQEHGVDEVVGFVPTGWVSDMRKEAFGVRRKGSCCVHLVPYSEHSAFNELTAYVEFMRPHKVIPTVGVGGEDADKCAARMVKHFRSLVDQTASKAKFLSAFHAKGDAGHGDSSGGGGGGRGDTNGRLASGRRGGDNGRATGIGRGGYQRGFGGKAAAAAVAAAAAALETKTTAAGAQAQAGAGAAEDAAAELRTVALAAMGEEEEEGLTDGMDTDMDACCRDCDACGSGVEAKGLEADRAEQQQRPGCTSSGEQGRAASAARQQPEVRRSKRKREGSTAAEQPPQQAQQAEQPNPEHPGEVVVLLDDSDDDHQAAAQHSDARPAGDGANSVPGTPAGPHADIGSSEKGGQASPGTPTAAAAICIAVGHPGPAQQVLLPGDQAGPSSAGSPSHEAQALQHLEAVLGGDLTQRQALQLLAAAGGDPQRAINMQLDGWLPPPPAAEGKGVAAVGSAGKDGTGVLASTMGTAARSPPAQPVARSPAPAAAKGRAQKGGAGGAAASKGGKKQKTGVSAAAAAAAGQRSILSFFSAGAAAAGGPSTSQSVAAGPKSILVEGSVGSGTPTSAAVAAQQQFAEEAGPEPDGRQGEGGQGLQGVREVVNATELASGPLAQQPVAASPLAAAPEAAAPPWSPTLAAARQHGLEPAVAVAAAAASAAEEGALAEECAGAKPKLVLPRPPAKSPSRMFGLGAKAGAQGQPERHAQVPRDAVTLSLEAYDPVGHAPWLPGEPAPYLHLARAFEAMDATTKRLRISDVLVNTFRSVLALSAADLVPAAYLATGKVAPDYEGMELNVGGSTVSAAIVEATGVSKGRLRDMHNQLGDIGDVAQACKRTQATLQRPAPLTVQGVLGTLRSLAREKGQGAAGRRQRSVLGLLRACRESETKYLTRTLVQALRVGANWRSVIPALAKAVLLHREGPKARLDAVGAAATSAFHVCPNLEQLVAAMVEGPLEELEARCTMTPGVPIKPMLAKITEGIPDAIKQLKGAPFLAEYKYDGMRAQIHMLPGGQVKVFSRNCEDRSAAYPDVAVHIREAAQGGSTSLVVDAELVAIERDPEGGPPRIRAFQELATRARGDVELAAISVAVCVFVFDLLYHDGQSLVRQPLKERRRALLQALPHMRPGYVMLAQSEEYHPEASIPGLATGSDVPREEREAGGEGIVDLMDTEEAALAGHNEVGHAGSQAAAAAVAALDWELGRVAPAENLSAASVPSTPLEASPAAALAAGPAEGGAALLAVEARVHEALLWAIAAGTEGLMLKSLAGAYEPSRRSDHWVKLKRDYVEGMHETLDLVPIGAWYGNGRKVGWYSPFLMAVYDPDTEELQSLCRCMSGFSDQFYKEATARLKERILPGPKPYYRTNEVPDVWFEPLEVWEIRGADLTISPVHKAAVGRLDMDRGVGLRFPRFVRIRCFGGARLPAGSMRGLGAAMAGWRQAVRLTSYTGQLAWGSGEHQDDKAVEDATAAGAIVQLYHAQTRKVEHAGRQLAAARGAAGAQAGEAGPGRGGGGEADSDPDGGRGGDEGLQLGDGSESGDEEGGGNEGWEEGD
ncbi:hypothetical protein N2152v2_003094 [Parachlorella kessleri]